MDPTTKSYKKELVRQLASFRSQLSIPDTRQLLSQSRQVLNVASKLPSKMQHKPTRTLAITAGLSFLLILFFKPRKKKNNRITITENERPASRQLLAFGLSVAQPIARIWLTEKARRWILRK